MMLLNVACVDYAAMTDPESSDGKAESVDSGSPADAEADDTGGEVDSGGQEDTGTAAGDDTGESTTICDGPFEPPAGATRPWAGALDCAFEWTELRADGTVASWISGGTLYFVEIEVEDGGDGDFSGSATTYGTEYDTARVDGRVGGGGTAIGACPVADLEGCVTSSWIDDATIQMQFYLEATNHEFCEVWCYGRVTDPPATPPEWLP